jgi:hypothetical protein
MRTPLDKALRGKLEKTVEKARDIVEIAVAEALTRLGIGDGSAPSYLSDEDRKLRTRLRAHGRQLGDVLHKETTEFVKKDEQETELLINEMAYEHWHRMLFARFLEQSDLLMYDQNTHVTLEECFELAEEGDPLGDGSEVKDGWELAGRLAQKMLPQIFRADSPVFEVKLSINHVNALEELIAALDKATFQASDALGWCYQFWQNKKKKQVNESGVKIGAKELSPVTQLFTEPYMVSFLLDNALGAWWAKRRLSKDDLLTATSEQELRELAAIPGVPLEYLRFVQNEETCAHSGEKVKRWSNAAGDFDKWPEDLSELRTLDPCCGSGHFLVAKFLMLVPMRMELEALTAKQAIDKVIAENIHGLELDQRCVELAAFALALEAWRYPGAGGYRQLPELQLACSGMSINEAQKEWKDLAKDDEELQGSIKWMQQTFKDAPTLGSLIDPVKSFPNLEFPWKVIQRKIGKEISISDTSVIANGILKSAELLSSSYTLVLTNVPYLGRGSQGTSLMKYCENNFTSGKNDLAYSMYQRLTTLCSAKGNILTVWPQAWLFQPSLKNFRNWFQERSNNIELIVGLGARAFETISGEVVNICLSITSNHCFSDYFALDLNQTKNIPDKINSLRISPFSKVLAISNEKNQGEVISLNKKRENEKVIGDFTKSVEGLSTGDKDQYLVSFWELPEFSNKVWEYYQNSPSQNEYFSGLDQLIKWENGLGSLSKSKAARIQGHSAWNKKGVLCSKMGELKSTIYLGTLYDKTCVALTYENENDRDCLYEASFIEGLNGKVRQLDARLCVATSIFEKVSVNDNNFNSFSILPFSNDLTFWIFHGHPCASVVWDEERKTTSRADLREDDTVLQVAVARLLGYHWPAELDAQMELAPEMREVIAKNNIFDDLIDDDGIVCIPAIRGEKPAVDRLEAILHAAYGDEWSATLLNNLLKSVKSRDLNLWLRDKFFEQHSKLFQHRPFIWQIWDGLPDGFSALVNYHTLDYKGLERLIYTYLDDWISTQIQQEKDGDEGAELRLTAARNLREQLEAILVGEKGLDIFVRWKSSAEQPIGWNPDLNDGVRLNIRPFMQAKDVGKKDAGILRSKPNIHWKKDRGTDVESAPWYDLGLEYGGKQGDRINDHHLTLAEKKVARDAK